MIRVELWAVDDMVFRASNGGAPYKYMSIGYLRRRVIESSKFHRNELRALVDYAN